MKIQISDFFGSYPDISDPDFNSLLSRKVEFSELKPPIREKAPQRGGRFQHQEFAIRFGTWYDRCAFFHDPGTGKSCIITGLAELFKDQYRKDEKDPTKIKEAIILLRGKTLEENIRNEILCKCTDRIYETEMVLRATNETQMKAAITRELNKWYSILTYREFATSISQIQRPEDVEAYMTNKAIFVDEAHNLVIAKDIQQNDPALRSEDLEGNEGDIEADENPEDETLGTDSTVYRTTFRAFHQGKRNKIFLFTATPMVNGPQEFPLLMNLILPVNKLMPLWNNEDFQILNFEQIEPYLRGRVSYIRALDTGARKVVPEGSLQPEGYQTWIYPCEMSTFQYEVYLGANQPQTSQKQAFYGNQRQISNFVFPDGSWGINGWNKYVSLNSGNRKYEFRRNSDGDLLRHYIRTPELFRQLSEKYVEIVRICREAYPNNPLDIREDQGIVFVYFPVYVLGSGAILAGLCLEEYGYEEYRENSSIFAGTQALGRPGPCSSYSGNARNEVSRQARISQRPRYVSLSHRTTPPQIVSMFDTLKSYENRYGQYIQVVIVSRIGQEGISIDHSIAEIMTSSTWNSTRMFQAETRIFRSTSHEVRLQEKRRKMIARGEDPSNATIDVRVYNMASVYPGNPDLTNPILRDPNTDTIDAQMFLLSEEKNRAISRVARFYKRASIDCYINYERNVRPSDINGSPTCDYTECGYTCSGIRREVLERIDRTTKILFYSEGEVTFAIEAIKTLFSRFSTLRIEKIYSLLQAVDRIFIDMALERMIRENTRVLSRMGFFGYLREAQNSDIYLERDPFQIRPVPENTAYTSVLIGTQNPRQNIFADYVINLEAINQEPLIVQLIEMGKRGETETSLFNDILESLALSNKVVLLEHVLYRNRVLNETSDFANAIISAFNNSIFELSEPIGFIQQIATRIASQGTGPGRKPGPNVKTKKLNLESLHIQVPEYNPTGPAERVTLHTLLNQDFERTSYNATHKFIKVEGKLRILKPSEGIGWRDVDISEQIAYNNLIQNQIAQIRNYYEQFEVYGILLPPSYQFRIRDRQNEDPTRAQADQRYIRNGKVCVTWSKYDLVNLLYRLQVPISREIPPGITREGIISYLTSQEVRMDLANFSDDQLICFFNWYRTGSGKPEFCQILQDFLGQTGRIFTGKLPQAAMNRPQIEGPESGSIVADLANLELED